MPIGLLCLTSPFRLRSLRLLYQTDRPVCSGAPIPSALLGRTGTAEQRALQLVKLGPAPIAVGCERHSREDT